MHTFCRSITQQQLLAQLNCTWIRLGRAFHAPSPGVLPTRWMAAPPDTSDNPIRTALTGYLTAWQCNYLKAYDSYFFCVCGVGGIGGEVEGGGINMRLSAGHCGVYHMRAWPQWSAQLCSASIPAAAAAAATQGEEPPLHNQSAAKHHPHHHHQSLSCPLPRAKLPFKRTQRSICRMT